MPQTREQKRAWYALHREAVCAQQRRKRQADLEGARVRQRASYRKHREKRLAAGRARRRRDVLVERQRKLQRYGMTLEGYAQILGWQGGACCICGQPGRRLVVDHNHATHETRSLLCAQCNTGIGFFGEDPERLRLAGLYLTAWSDPDARAAEQRFLEGA